MNDAALASSSAPRVGRSRRAAALALACAVAGSLACSLLAGCGAAHVSVQPRATHGAAPGATSSPTANATATPTATDIPLAVLTGATLGGTSAGFTATYGAPSGPARWDAQGTSFTITLATGTDGLPHVGGLVAHPSDGSTWTASQARQVCGGFLPPDAVHARDTTTTTGDQEAIYLSGQLATTFLPSAFGDASPGTLAIDYAPSAGGAVAQCKVVTGTV